LKKKFTSCMRTLSELGVEKDKITFALNKSDMTNAEDIEQKVNTLNLVENKKWIIVSAKTGKNVNRLKELVKEIIENSNFSKSKGYFSEGETKGFAN